MNSSSETAAALDGGSGAGDPFEPSAAEIAAARVIVVDDEPMVTASLVTFLSIELDIEAVAFNDPTSALAYLSAHEVDLVISDFLMPQMDGIRFLVAARKAQPGVPRVLLTGYADKKNAITAINEVKLFQYIEKPWDNDQLKSVVLRALRSLRLVRQLAVAFDQVAEQHPDFRGAAELLYAAIG